MKTLLITPPCIELYRYLRPTAPKSPPLGLAYIASVLLEHNFKVDILDTFALDLSWKQIIEKIKNYNAEIFGSSCLTSTLREVVFLSKIIKKFHPHSIFIIGGTHPTAEPIQTISNYPDIDIIGIGEGEYTVLELHEYIAKFYNYNKPFNKQNSNFYEKLLEIKGIVFKHPTKGIIKTNERPFIENLDEIPYPAYHLLPNDKYAPPSKFPMIKPYSSIITVRGCPYNCIFCAAKIICGRKLRERSIENIRGELKLLKEKYNIKNLWINDSTFTIKRKRSIEVSKILSEYNFKWACNTRVDFVDPILLQFLNRCGCNVIEYGFESGLEKVLKKLKKQITPIQIKKAVEWTKKAGILISGAFMIGIPGDTYKSVKQSLKFARSLNPDFFSLAILTPYPGTEIYDIAKEKGYLAEKFVDYRSPKHFKPVINLPTISNQELSNLWLNSNLKFYIRIKYLITLLKNLIREPKLFYSILLDILTASITFSDKLKKIFNKKKEYGRY